MSRKLNLTFGLPASGVQGLKTYFLGNVRREPDPATLCCFDAGEERGGEAPQATAEGEHEAEDGGTCAEEAASRESLPLSRVGESQV